MRTGAVRYWVCAAVVLVALALPAAQARAQGALSALQTDVDQIARRARPSVVTVYAHRAEPAARTVAANGQPIPRLRTRVGSGVAIDENLILTTASVVLDAERILVRTANGLQVETELVGLDPVFNLALLRAPALRLPALKLAEGRPAEVGDWVISLGTTYKDQPTQSIGNVAQRYREPRQSLLQLSNTVYPGNSGAAALNTRGELIGLVQGELGSPDLTESAAEGERRPSGASFALPVETIRTVVAALKREGKVRHGFLGLTTRAASVEGVREESPRIPIGAQVEKVVPGSPAEKLGIRAGDLVVAFDRERVEYPEQLARWVASTRPGITVAVVWVRDELEHNGRVALAESAGTPQWLAGPSGDENADGSPKKIADLEKQIKRLSQELERIKDQSTPPPH